MSTVTVQRLWHETMIRHTVTFDDDGVSITMPLEEFVDLLTKELILKTSTVGFVVSRSPSFRNEVIAATQRVVHHMKESTAQV